MSAQLWAAFGRGGLAHQITCGLARDEGGPDVPAPFDTCLRTHARAEAKTMRESREGAGAKMAKGKV